MINQKNVVIALSMIAIVLLSVLLMSFFSHESEAERLNITESSLAFKAEMEHHNGLINEDDIGQRVFITLDIPSHNPMVYASYLDIFKLLENGTGVILFGSAICPWSRNFIPVLVDAAIEFGLKEILFLDILEDRDEKELDNRGRIETIKEGNEDYHRLLKALNEFIPAYRDLNDPNIKRIYFPTAVFVKDGVVLGIVSANDMINFNNRTDGNPYEIMNEIEKDTLLGIFINRFEEVFR